MKSSKDIAIIGAGLVGSLLAIFMSRRGHRVSIFEKRPDMRKAGIAGGRSINLALSDRGIRALQSVGIMDAVEEICIPMPGRQLHQADGSEYFQPYGKEGQFINSVSRAALNQLLMSEAEKSGASIYFDRRCISIDFKKNEMVLQQEQSGDTEKISADIFFGADGAFSVSRLQMQLQLDRFNYSQSYVDYGYKELSIPAGEYGRSILKKNALHIWPRGNFMLIALPNTDGSFTCTLFLPFDGNPSFDMLKNEQRVTSFFQEHFVDVCPLMPTLMEDFFTNPTSSLVTISCHPWIVKEKMALIGDSAHAMVPFYGQGMNCGFEDCQVLDELMEKHEDDWENILYEYQLLRKADGDAISSLALTNFIEMRDKVADEKFLLQKKVEAAFAEKYPNLWTPAYSMVTFSPQLRYSEALRRSEAQQKIMDHIMSEPDIFEKWEGPETEERILENIKQSAIE